MAIVDTAHPVITFLSDFGLKDNYVGVVKGVILGLNQKASIIDITHNIPHFRIAAARYLLETSHNQFPPGTIHLAVVDPGVGTSRKALLIETEYYYFIGPDNGLFSFLPNKDIKRVISLANQKYFLKSASFTFQARDIFAPVAAYLSLGVSPSEMGGSVKSIVRLEEPPMSKDKGQVVGKLIYIDHFGNLVSSLKRDEKSSKGIVYLNNFRIGPLQKTFGSVPHGRPVCYINSFGYLEIAVSEGSAAQYFGIDEMSRPKILIATNDTAR